MKPATQVIRDGLVSGAEAGNFSDVLLRPVPIYSTTWSSAAFTAVNIDPWALFLNSDLVNRVTKDYAALRGDLHVEFQLNGTPFHYGCMIAAYQPGVNGSRKIGSDVMQLSTCPHVLLDPATSNVGKMTLPMITPNTFLQLDAVRIGSGTISLAEIVGLGSASGTIDTITLNVYAYMTEAKLSLPVSNNVARNYTPQAGKEETEASTKGFVSSPLRKLSRWAGYLTTVPTIGPFATAASQFAATGADLAKLFGYSRPRDITVPTNVLHSLGSSFANTDAVDSSSSLALTTSTALSVDPRIFGLASGEDELAINSIASRWGLISSTEWSISQTVNDLVFQMPVSPASGLTTWTAAAQISPFTPLYYASLPFDYWSGSIEVKVQIVCSKYHRGRLRIQWAQSSTFSDPASLNSSFSHIIDISDKVDHCFTIPFAAAQGFLQVQPPDQIGYSTNRHNGTFRISVQNELTSPEAVSTAHVLLWVRGGPDFKVGAPGKNFNRLSNYNFQSGDEDMAAQKNQCKEHMMFERTANDHLYDVYIAEPVTSFRPLLKRFSHNFTLTAPDVNLNGLSFVDTRYMMPHHIMEPGLPPYDTGVWDTPLGNYNFASMTMAAYLGNPFLAKRGGMRWKVHTTLPPNIEGRLVLGRTGVDASKASTILSVWQSAPELSSLFGRATKLDAGILGQPFSVGSNSWAGIQPFSTSSDKSREAEVEIPFYSGNKFYTENNYEYNQLGTDSENGWDIYTRLENQSTTAMAVASLQHVVYCAGSEDYTVGVWRGIQSMYYNSNYSAATGAGPAISSYSNITIV